MRQIDVSNVFLNGKFGFFDVKTCNTPISNNNNIYTSNGTLLSDPSEFNSVVGSLQYLAITRPNIAFAINKVCQFMATLMDTHWAEVKRNFRYLAG